MAAAAGATAALLLAAGCLTPRMPAELVLFVSGDSRGYLEPCGCRRDQAGGLPGRATVIEQRKAAAKLVLDVGNLTTGSRPYEMLKLRYMAQGMAKIGYDAVNLGRKEAQLDRTTLQQMVRDSALPFVSCNVVDKSTRKPLAEPFRIVHRDGLRIGVTGVANAEAQEIGPGVDVRPPLEALAEVIPELRKQCDYLIVLAFVDEDGLRDIASKFHEVDCLLGGDVSQPSNGVQKINRAIVFSVTDQGKVIGEIDLRRAGGGYTVANARGIKILKDKIVPQKDMVALIARYKNELRERRFELASAEGMERIAGRESTADEFLGDRACQPCHAGECRVATASQHRHAFDTLVRAKSEYDPDCLRCHTVAYGMNSGFVDAQRTPHLTGVQCENCHGRGKDHVRAMNAVLAQPSVQAAVALARKPGNLKPVTQATCISCHDKENSEGFVYRTFWPKIAHVSTWHDAGAFWRAAHKAPAASGQGRALR